MFRTTQQVRGRNATVSEAMRSHNLFCSLELIGIPLLKTKYYAIRFMLGQVKLLKSAAAPELKNAGRRMHLKE